jgi:hypothetical protein
MLVACVEATVAEPTAPQWAEPRLVSMTFGLSMRFFLAFVTTSLPRALAAAHTPGPEICSCLAGQSE